MGLFFVHNYLCPRECRQSEMRSCYLAFGGGCLLFERSSYLKHYLKTPYCIYFCQKVHLTPCAIGREHSVKERLAVSINMTLTFLILSQLESLFLFEVIYFKERTEGQVQMVFCGGEWDSWLNLYRNLKIHLI